MEDRSTHENPFALIRYVKGKSDMGNPLVRAFRSVVWDTIENVPVSVTPFKSVGGECLPTDALDATYTIERFVDGVMIGAFYDKYSASWRIHTRSALDARTRFYSQDKTFKQMFDDWALRTGLNWDAYDKSASYTFVLQHPENRIVVPVSEVRVTLVQKTVYKPDLAFENLFPLAQTFASWAELRARLAEFNGRFKHAFQGFVVKGADGQRWKIRTEEYNRVRRLRGNTARRDYMWLTMWSSGTLNDYLRLFPEERFSSGVVINKWKRVTGDIYHIYTDVFKARTLAKTAIPPKYRPLVHGLHKHYLDTLKPASKTVDWKATVAYMNARDTAQMLFVINWELRQTAKMTGLPVIPLEPSGTVETAVESTIIYRKEEEEDADLPDLIPMLDAHIVAQLTGVIAVPNTNADDDLLVIPNATIPPGGDFV